MSFEREYPFSSEEFTKWDENGVSKRYAVCSICGRETESEAGIDISYDSGYDGSSEDLDFFYTGRACWCEKCKAEIGAAIYEHVEGIRKLLDDACKRHSKERFENMKKRPDPPFDEIFKSLMGISVEDDMDEG